MENLLKDLMSGETMGRLSAVEKTASKLANKSWLKDVPNDMKMKLMNASVNTVKDANPKIVVAGLNCLDLLIKNYKDDFSPMIAMSFDLLLAKLGDAKSVIREHALEVTLNLIGLMGMGSAFAVVTTHLNHKNQRVKESLLTIVSRLQTQHGLELRSVVSATSMCKAVAPLLNDSVGALRQLAVTTLAEMYPLYGEDIVDSLSAVEIRPAQEKLLLAAIYACKQKGHNQQQLQVAANSKHAAAAADDDEVDPWSLLNDEEDGFSHPPQQANTSRLSPTGVPREREGFESSNGGNFSSRGDAGVSTSKPPMRRSLSATQRRPVSTHPSSSSAAVLSSTESHQFASTVGAHSTASSASFDTVPSVSDGAAREPTSCYDPSGFMGFIQLKQGLKPTEIVDDRDLQKLVSKIAADMGKKTDWEARTSALIALQKLALGNLRDFKNCVDVVKSMNDLISTQIIDLRSTVSKEACKAVAALAYTLRQQFCPLAELWWLQLVRVVVVKIQVISSSADRCIRVVVACCQDQRLLSMIMEACGNKNPPLRRLSLEYLALACASWRSDIIEKNVNAIKQVVRVAVADADSGARKTARQLYWVLHNTPALQSHMKGVFNDLEAAIQRHINAEATSDSPEMSDLFLIVQNPSCLLDYARTCSTTSTNSTTTSSNEGSVAEEAKPSVSSTMRGIADSKPARASSAKPAARAQAIHHTSSAAAAATAAAVAKPAPKGQQATEQDRVTDRHQEFDFASTASGAVASTAMKSSRRLSLTAGPVRLVGATTSAGGTGAVGSSWESGEAPGGVATKTPSASTAMSSRRLSLQTHTMAPPGHSLTRSTDFSAADTCNSSNNNNSSSTEDLHMGATTLSVSSLLSIPQSSTSLATSSSSSSSFLSQGAVRNLDAKTPAVKASGSGTGTRPSLFSAAHQPPSIDEEAELPSSSVSLAVSAESLKFDRYLHAEEEHSSHTISSTPAVPSTARINRRASLGAFPMTGSAAGALTSTAGTISGTSSSVSTGVSSLLNGPKRIIRAPQGQNAPEQPSSGTQIAAAGANTSAGDAGDMGRAVTQHAVAVTPAPSNQQRPSVLLCSQVGAHVATVADSALKAAVAAAEGEDRKKGDNGHAENGVFVFSGETLRTMVQDTQWSTRVKAFESINVRLQRAISTSEALNEGMIETFVDLCLPHLADPHHKVASDALQVLQSCIAAYPNFIKSRLGAILLALFHRLADRRSAIRDQANSILNLMRSTLDSVQIMGALSPRMGEVPDRMKTALMQFMGAIAPHCDEFFAQATNTWAFLSRMAHIISGSGGTKPSVTLTVAARRLLELVFKTTPVMMCSQIAALPFQQQIALKKFLEASVPDIDLQVMQASKAEWTGKSQAPLASKSVLTAEGLAMSMSAEMDAPQQLPSPPFAGAVSAQSMSDDNWEELESSFQTDRTAQSSVFELKTRPGMGGRDDRSKALSEAVMSISASSHSHSRIVSDSDSDSVAVCGATAPPSSPPSVVANTVTATATADAALFSPPPPPAPAATPPPASAASSPAEPMSFTPRNLSAAAIEAEVRTLEFIDACHHSRSPSENISPNSPDFQRKTPAPTVDSLGLTPKDKDAYMAKLPAFATLDDPTISAVLASKRAIDLATEEIIQRYSPTKTPSPVLASAVSVVDIILDPTAELLHHALSSAYSDSHSSSAKAMSSPTPTRPSQLPHHKSLIGSNSVSKHDAVATQETQEAQQVALGASQSSGPDAAVRLHNVNSSSPVVKATSHKKVAPFDAAAATPSAAKPVLSSTAGLGTPPVSARKTSAAPSAGKATTPPMPAARVAHKSPSPARAALPGPVKKDTFWLLESLKPTAALPVREEASRELKLRIKTADDSYWLQNYAQIVTVLLESFRADARECPSSSSSSSSTIHAPTSNKRASTASSATLVGFEHMECSTKSLLLLMRYRGPHMKNLLEVLVDKLCRAAAFAPAPISQTLEGVLSELARHDALRLLKALLPYATFSSSCAAGNNSANSSSSSSGGGNDSSLDVGVAGSVGECPQVRLMALHVLCNAVRFLTSAQLLSELPTCVPAVLSSINSSLADLRKAVVFILVEMYLAVGDSVFPYVHSLTPPQRKLLTIYIEKRMNERKNIVAAAQQS